MHHVKQIVVLNCLLLVALAGCRSATQDPVVASRPEGNSGILSSMASRFRAAPNRNARPGSVKPVSGRNRVPGGRSGEGPAEEVDELMASIENESPEFQARMQLLAAAIRDRDKALEAQRSQRSGDPAKDVRQVSATSSTDSSHKPSGQPDNDGLAPAEPSENVASSKSSDPEAAQQRKAQSVHKTNPSPASNTARATPAKSQPAATEDNAKDKAAVKDLAEGTTDQPKSVDDAPAESKVAATEESKPGTTTVELESESPEDLFAALTFEQQLDLLIKHLDSQKAGAIDTPEGLRHAFTARMLHLLANNADEALRPVSELSANEQEYMRHQLMSIWSVLDPEGSPTRGRRWDAALENLRLASSHLAAAKESLVVNGIAFCTEVESYGRITPFDNYSFEPGQQVILYCELDHFAAERLSAGYETHFQGSYDIFNAEGVRVAEQVLPADKQTCTNFRRDYFIAYRLYLPKQLQPGSHRIQLTIEDLKGKKYGQSVLDFEIVSKRVAAN